MSKQSQITLVELPPTQFGVLDGDASFDVYSQFRLPSRSLPTLEAVLRKVGHQDVQSINPLFHGNKGKLTKENQERIYGSKYLLISAITRTAPQSIMLGNNFREVNPRGTVIAGGPDPTFRAEEWLTQGGADIVVLGEGEKTLVELLERLEEDPLNIGDIRGIAYKRGEEIEVTRKRELLTSEELSIMPLPFYDRVISSSAIPVVETSRGCPYRCDFCSVSEFCGSKYRSKSESFVIRALAGIHSWNRSPFFIDDHIGGNPKRAIDFLGAIERAGVDIPGSSAQISVDAAKNPKLLSALKGAGIDILYVGIESIVDKTLEAYKKPVDAKKNKEAVEVFRENGFWIHGMMMPGGDGDTPEELRQTSEWINENLDSVQLFPPTPLPGTGFTRRMREEGRILSDDFSLYDGQSVLVRPMHFTPYELQKTVNDMYRSFYSFGRCLRRIGSSPNRRIASQIFIYTQFMNGIKKVLNSPQAQEHLEFLRSVS